VEADITWNFAVYAPNCNSEPATSSVTSSNEVFVTYAEPIVATSVGRNPITDMRLRRTIQECTLEDEVSDPGTAAYVLQHFLGRYADTYWSTYNRAQANDDIWGLLDVPRRKNGECAQTAALLTMMLGQVGIDAKYEQLFATSPEEFARNGGKIRSAGWGKGNNLEERTPSTLGGDYDILTLDFDDHPNAGEGGVLVEGNFYTCGATENSLVVGMPGNGRSAEYWALYCLGNNYHENICFFQRWYPEKRGGEPAGYPPGDGDWGPFPPLP
jgi:hypothetical protein